MAIGVTKVNADSLGVVAVDESALSNSFGTRGGNQTAQVTHFTVSRNPTFVAIVIKNGSSEAIDVSNELDVGESVEAVLRVCAENASILGYQVEYDSTGQISVMLEGPHTQSTYGTAGTSSFASDLQTRVRALGTAVGANSIDVSGSTVTNVAFKLATS